VDALAVEVQLTADRTADLERRLDVLAGSST
jgi:hypothetical protein